MSEPKPDEGRSTRWVLIAVVATALLVVAGVIGAPWVVRRDLIANQAKCCEIAADFERERPGATPDGPPEVGQCLRAIVDGLDTGIRDRLERGQVEHTGALRRPSDPLGPALLDVPLSPEVFAAVDRCARSRTSRWRPDHGLAEQGLLERYAREAHLERDPDVRLRRLATAMELWGDAMSMYSDLPLAAPLMWAREIGQTGTGDSATMESVAERLIALAASLPDIETSTAIFYCAVYGEVTELDLLDSFEANDEFGASLAMASRTEPATWGHDSQESRLERAIPTGVQHDQFVEPGSAYVGATLMAAARHLQSDSEPFLGQMPELSDPDADSPPFSRRPCAGVVLPSALDDRELGMCHLDPDASYAGRELVRLFRALRAAAIEGEPIPERIDDLTDGDSPEPAAPTCMPVERSGAAREAWQQIGYDAPATRRVTLTLLHPTEPPPVPMTGTRWAGFDAGWRQLRARWQVGRVPNLLEPEHVICDGPVHEVRLWIDGPPHDPRARPLEWIEASEPAAESP